MNDFGDWFQNNWYQLGSFFIQIGFSLQRSGLPKRSSKPCAFSEQVGASAQAFRFRAPLLLTGRRKHHPSRVPLLK